jgi:sec-independent protein translocase protein TatA
MIYAFSTNVNFLLLDGISGGELVFVFLIILIFFGSKSIPKFARTMGRGIRNIKDATQEIQRDIKKSSQNPLDDINNIKETIIDPDK